MRTEEAPGLDGIFIVVAAILGPHGSQISKRLDLYTTLIIDNNTI